MSNELLKFDINWITSYGISNLYKYSYSGYSINGVELSSDGKELLNDLKCLRKFIDEGRKLGQSANQILRRMGSSSLEDFKERTSHINHSSIEYVRNYMDNEYASQEVRSDLIQEYYNDCCQMLKSLSELDKAEEDKFRAFENKVTQLTNEIYEIKEGINLLLRINGINREVYKLKELVQEQREYTPEEIDFIKNTVINYYEDIWEKPRNRQSYKEVQYIFSLLNTDLPAFTGRVTSSLENIEEAVERLIEQSTHLPIEQSTHIPTEQDTDITVDLDNMIYIEEEGIWYNEDDGTSLSVEEYKALRNKHSMKSVEW